MGYVLAQIMLQYVKYGYIMVLNNVSSVLRSKKCLALAKWRYTFAETENISNARSASPLAFRSSTPKHDFETNQTSGLDKNNDSQSGRKK